MTGRKCRRCPNHVGPGQRLCKECSLEQRYDTDATHARTPLETLDGRTVGSWILVDGTWHASVAFDGHVHEFACGHEWDDFPADGCRLDHHGIDAEAICRGCREAIDPESVPMEWRDGGFSTGRELRADGGLDEVYRRETIVATDDGIAIGEDAVPRGEE